MVQVRGDYKGATGSESQNQVIKIDAGQYVSKKRLVRGGKVAGIYKPQSKRPYESPSNSRINYTNSNRSNVSLHQDMVQTQRFNGGRRKAQKVKSTYQNV